jgi:hypothetical protein
MSDENNKAGRALQKLGQRLRLGLLHRLPENKKTTDAAMAIIRKQVSKELEERNSQALQTPSSPRKSKRDD